MDKSPTAIQYSLDKIVGRWKWMVNKKFTKFNRVYLLNAYQKQIDQIALSFPETDQSPHFY